ncbi:hypothetical protein D3C81_1805580 [compost metagenome]
MEVVGLQVERECVCLEGRQPIGDLLAITFLDPDIDVRGRWSRRCQLLLAGLGLYRCCLYCLGLRHGEILLVDEMVFTIEQTNPSDVIKVLNDSIDEHYQQTFRFLPAPEAARHRWGDEP